MTTEINSKIQALPRLGRPELLALWRELFATPPHPRLRRELMIPILAYGIQEHAYGGVKPSTRKRLQKLAAELEQNQKTDAPSRYRVMLGSDWTYELGTVDTMRL